MKKLIVLAVFTVTTISVFAQSSTLVDYKGVIKNIAFQYPADWVLDDSENRVQVNPSSHKCYFQIECQPNDMTEEILLAKAKEDGRELKRVQFNGMSGFAMSKDITLILHGGFLYMIDVSSGNNECSEPTKAVAASFKFLP